MAAPPAPIVLFVDDELEALDALRRTMRMHRPGWQVLTAAGAQEAVSLLAAHAVSVVVTDMNMSGHDGVDLLQFLQTYHPTVGRIALTGMLDGATFLSPGHKAAHHYLIKPCPHDRLLAAIEDRMTGG
jgi:two-component system, NtrC family, response regulator HupR/HoxA